VRTSAPSLRRVDLPRASANEDRKRPRFPRERVPAAGRRLAPLFHTTLPGATLLGALVFAPWFWGCTWPLGIRLLDILLLSATAAWSLGMLLRGEPSRLPAALPLAVLLLLAQGWFMALNAHSTCDPVTGLYHFFDPFLPGLPGSVDRDPSRETMLRVTGLLGAGMICAWLGRSGTWRRRLLRTAAATAVSVVLIGCLQRWTRAPDIFWNSTRHLDFFFATYRNVTNAGEYLNLILPLAASLLLVAVARRAPLRVALGACALVILATGSIVSGSKMAPLVTGLAAVLFVLLQGRDLVLRIHRVELKRRALTLAIAFLVLAAIVESVGLGVTLDRWGRVFQERNGGATFSHRLLVDRVCVSALPDAGFFGFGPGTFRAVFPYYSNRVEGDLAGVWTYAHDDYAQTAVEWGVLGAASWSLYFFGGSVLLLRGWCRRWWRTENRLIAAGLLTALALAAGMALVDFPLQIASIQLVIALVAGLSWSCPGWSRAQAFTGEKNLRE
jgi:hypothetical protein